MGQIVQPRTDFHPVLYKWPVSVLSVHSSDTLWQCVALCPVLARIQIYKRTKYLPFRQAAQQWCRSTAKKEGELQALTSSGRLAAPYTMSHPERYECRLKLCWQVLDFSFFIPWFLALSLWVKHLTSRNEGSPPLRLSVDITNLNYIDLKMEPPNLNNFWQWNEIIIFSFTTLEFPNLSIKRMVEKKSLSNESHFL